MTDSDCSPAHGGSVVDSCGEGSPVTRMCSTPPVSSAPSLSRMQSSATNRKLPLPPGKKYHYFLSHRKTHSKYGGVPEQVARNIHDNLEMNGFIGFFDIDNLDRVSKDDVKQAIEQTCVVVAFLDDETAESEWRRFEWECAEQSQVPVKCVVDMQRFAKGEVMAKVEKHVGSRYLFSYQWCEFTERHRRQTMKELFDFISGSAKIDADALNAISGNGSHEIENLRSELMQQKAASKLSNQGMQAAAILQEQEMQELREQLRNEEAGREKMLRQLEVAQGEASSAGRALRAEQRSNLQQAKEQEEQLMEQSKKEMDILKELHKANASSRKAEFDAESLREDLRRELALNQDQAKKMETAVSDLKFERHEIAEAAIHAKAESQALHATQEKLVEELRAQLLSSHTDQAALMRNLEDAQSLEQGLRDKQALMMSEATTSEQAALLSSREEVAGMLEEHKELLAAAAALKLTNDVSHQSQLDEILALTAALAAEKSSRASDLLTHQGEQSRLKSIMEEATDAGLRGELHEERAANLKQVLQISADKKKLELEKQAVKLARKDAEKGLEAAATANEELMEMRKRLKKQEAEQALMMAQLHATKKEAEDVEQSLRDEQQRGIQQAKDARSAAMESSKKEMEAMRMMGLAQAETHRAEMGAEALRSQLRRERVDVPAGYCDAILATVCCCRSSSN